MKADIQKSSFYEDVYEVVRHIPKGKVATYGMIASIIGSVRLARAVGYALHANPDNKLTPCHRVVFRDGSLSPAFVFGGEQVQRTLLEKEGITFDENGKVNLEKHLWDRNFDE